MTLFYSKTNNKLLAIGFALVTLGSLLADAAPKPNIVFIFSDDHASQTIGAYNGRLSDFVRENKITPNIDRLAEQGAVFDRSFCGTALCSPSRATVLTGVHSHISGVVGLNQPIPKDLWTFPPALQAAGYQTALFGKWHLESEPVGFDLYRVLHRQGQYWDPIFSGPDGLKEKDTGYTTDIITDRALAWLEARDKSKPFILMVQHKAPHEPCEPPPRYYKLLADVDLPEPPTLFDDFSGRTSSAKKFNFTVNRLNLKTTLKVLPAGQTPRKVPASDRAAWLDAFGERNKAFQKADLKGADLIRWKYQEYFKDYLRTIKAVDDSVGRLTDYLGEKGLDNNTVIIYASDQGFFIGEHGWYNKHWIYEESISMPLILRWPAVVKPGTRIQQMVQNIDYAPTFMELAGLKAPDSVQGRSLVPLLRGETPADWRHEVYYHAPKAAVPAHYGIRTERYTLVHFYEVNEWELFDLQKDPQQLNCVYDNPEYAKTCEGLKRELTQLRSRYQVPDEVIITKKSRKKK